MITTNSISAQALAHLQPDPRLLPQKGIRHPWNCWFLGKNNPETVESCFQGDPWPMVNRSKWKAFPPGDLWVNNMEVQFRKLLRRSQGSEFQLPATRKCILTLALPSLFLSLFPGSTSKSTSLEDHREREHAMKQQKTSQTPPSRCNTLVTLYSSMGSYHKWLFKNQPFSSLSLSAYPSFPCSS